MCIYIYSIYPRGSNSDHKPGAQNEHQPNAENNKGLIIICIYIYTSNHNIFTRFDLQQRQKLDLGSKDFGWPGESFSCCLSCEFLFQGEPLSVSSLISFSHLSSFGFLNQSIHIIRWNTLTFRKWTLPNITWHCLTLPNIATLRPTMFAICSQCGQYRRPSQNDQLDAVCTSGAWHLSSLSDALPNGHDLEACRCTWHFLTHWSHIKRKVASFSCSCCLICLPLHFCPFQWVTLLGYPTASPGLHIGADQASKPNGHRMSASMSCCMLL
jgi:hypothetical protein